MSNEKREVGILSGGFDLFACSDPEDHFTTDWRVTNPERGGIGFLPGSLTSQQVEALLWVLVRAYDAGRNDESRERTRRLLAGPEGVNDAIASILDRR